MIPSPILDRLIKLRHQFHSFPQIGFTQFQTRERIKKILIEFGIKENQWKEMAKTGLIVDLTGQAPEQGDKKCIAFRADVDALSMEETNHHLQYKSKIPGVAHMCGHDGHMTCLIGFVALFLPLLPKIPKNKKIRLLFQPSQQGPLSGAQLMVKQGCLQGVDQVYGCHQLPSAPIDELWCKEGPVTSQFTIIKIKVIGTSGHGSQPQKLKVAIWQGMQLYQKIKNYLDELKKQKPDVFTCTLPVFQAGERFNVISQSVYIEGSIRSFEQGLKYVICDKIKGFLKESEDKGFKIEFNQHLIAPININTKNQANHVLKVGQKVFGKDKVGTGKLPIKASEDFAYFSQVKPGAYFFLTSARNQQNPPYVHNSNFDFNDELIPKAAEFWFELAKERLQIKQ